MGPSTFKPPHTRSTRNLLSSTGTGHINIGTGGTLQLDKAASDNTITFSDATGVLTLEHLGSIANTVTIVGLQAGDLIELSGVPSGFQEVYNAGTVVISNAGTTLGTLVFGGTLPSAAVVQNAIETVPCFAAGTRIATPHGAVVVEQLREGDEVLTVSGGRQSIQWIGHRRVDCRSHPDRKRVLPIQIMPHVFGEGRPKRPLLLSPDHAVFVEDVLIPIKFLLTDTTIEQIDVDNISYYHIELPRHGVVLAEGMPAETYLETGGRSAFENAGGATQLHPDFEPDPARVGMVWNSFGYAPLLGENGELERVRAKLAWQARMLASPVPRAFSA